MNLAQLVQTYNKIWNPFDSIESHPQERRLPTYNVDLIYPNGNAIVRPQPFSGNIDSQTQPQPPPPPPLKSSTAGTILPSPPSGSIPFSLFTPTTVPRFPAPLPRTPFTKRPIDRNSKEFRKKQKREDLSDTDAFYCEACEKSFKTQEKYSIHINSHIGCDFGNCSFRGVEKIVKLHKLQVHNPRVISLMKTLNDPEELKKWIAERKARFPTAANIAKKEEQRRNTSSVVIGERGKGFSRQGAIRGRNFQRGNYNLSRLDTVYSRSECDSEKKEVLKAAVDNKTMTTMSIIQSNNRNDSENDINANCSDNLKTTLDQIPTLETTNILDSSPEEISSKETYSTSTYIPRNENSPNSNYRQNKNHNGNGNNSRICRFFARGKCRKGEHCTFLHEIKAKETSSFNNNNNPNKNNNNNNKYQHTPQRHRLTLLQKFFENEINEERNTILQCLRYIVLKNFFQQRKTDQV